MPSNMNGTASSDACYACRFDGAIILNPATAFLAGIAFVFQFNDDAMRRKLCAAHAAALIRGYVGSSQSVAPEDRRTDAMVDSDETDGGN